MQALHALGFALDALVADGEAAVANGNAAPANGRVAEGLVFKLYHPNSDDLRTLRVLEPDLSAHLCGPSKVSPYLVVITCSVNFNLLLISCSRI